MDPQPVVDPTATVLGIVDQVVRDLHRRRTPPRASLDSRLERDLGLDSLAMAEVLACLEEAFGVGLSPAVLATAETPRDLLRALDAGRGPARPRPAPLRDLGTDRSVAVAESAGTLLAVLEWHCRTHADEVHLHLLGDAGEETSLTYEDLRRGGSAVAQGLLDGGLAPRETVALMLPTSREYFEAFMGVLMAGGVPVPVYPPARPSQIEEHLRRHVKVLSNAQAALLLTVPEAKAAGRLLRASVPSLRRVVSVSELVDAGGREPLPRVEEGDTALIQYTSGSTGQPKGVVLSHANVLANIRAMGEGAEVTPADVFVSWLPLYHDMGLIGAWLGSLCLGMKGVIMSPLSFLARPARWWEAVGDYGGSVTAAPNFAYELCLRKVTEGEMEHLDLSSMRIALNGAEPVSADTMERFALRFTRCGLRPEALFPVFGLAECGVGLAFPPLGRGVLVDTVRTEDLRRHGRALPAERGAPGTTPFVACGQPLPGYEIRVVDEAGREVGERLEGEVEFRGPSDTSGYYRNPEATARLFHDGWLDTGDLGYFSAGDLFITGRTKDLIIKAGRNVHPEELEAAVAGVDGVRKGGVAAFGVPDREAGTEKLVVVAETQEVDEQARGKLREDIVASTVDALGTPPDDVVLVPPGTVPKTSSGKTRRAACAELYETGALGRQRLPVWWQVARFAWSGLGSRLRRYRSSTASVGYAGYCWVIFSAVGAAAVAAAALLPRLRWRRRAVRAAANLLLRLSGTPLGVHGGDRLPEKQPCVLVSNHQSWLDGLVLAAWLPATFSFVAGEVLRDQKVAGFLLKRIGSEFVERSQPGDASASTARLARAATTASLVVFPEGGVSRAPGLRPFHLGAFVAAAEAKRPLVPLAIRGTRSMLRPGQKFMRRGTVRLFVGEPIAAVGDGRAAAISLERQAREVILRHCGEPDLE